MGREFDADAQYEFLAALREVGKTSQACRITGWDKSTVTRAKKASKAFKDSVADATACFEDHIKMDVVKALYSRGVKGWKEPIVDRHGNVVGQKDKFSERCLIKLAERFMPEFRTNNPTVDVNINSGVLAIPTSPTESDPQKALEEWTARYADFEVEEIKDEE